jgi:hypothetical protein
MSLPSIHSKDSRPHLSEATAGQLRLFLRLAYGSLLVWRTSNQNQSLNRGYTSANRW